MSNRRDFLKTAAFAALGSGMAINHVFAGGNDAPSLFNVNSRAGVTPKMKLRFFPYELKLRHVFTVATYSRTTTPDVQVEIEYDGIIGYGEASMPPYLQHELGTMDSVLAFLKKVQDVIGQFSDPFQLEDILAEIVTLPGELGSFSVLYDHAPLISSLIKGEIKYTEDELEKSIGISSGFVEVRDNIVSACVEI